MDGYAVFDIKDAMKMIRHDSEPTAVDLGIPLGDGLPRTNHGGANGGKLNARVFGLNRAMSSICGNGKTAEDGATIASFDGYHVDANSLIIVGCMTPMHGRPLGEGLRELDVRGIGRLGHR